MQVIVITNKPPSQSKPPSYGQPQPQSKPPASGPRSNRPPPFKPPSIKPSSIKPPSVAPTSERKPRVSSKPPLSEPPCREYRTTMVFDENSTEMPKMEAGAYSVRYARTLRGSRYVTVNMGERRVGEMILEKPGESKSLEDHGTRIKMVWEVSQPLGIKSEELVVRLEKI